MGFNKLLVNTCLYIVLQSVIVVHVQGEVNIVDSPGISRLCHDTTWKFTWHFGSEVDTDVLTLRLGKYSGSSVDKVQIFNLNFGVRTFDNGYSIDKLIVKVETTRVDFEMLNINSNDVGKYYLEAQDLTQTEAAYNENSGLYVFTKPIQPYIEPQGGTTLIAEGGSTTIICASPTKIITTALDGDPLQPKFIYTWHKENKEVMTGHSNRYIIDASQNDHKTQYYCTIQDGMCPGTISDKSDVITVLVTHEPDTPSIDIDNPDDAMLGASVLLTCVTGTHTGYPIDVLGYSFYLDGIVVANSSSNVFNISELTEDKFGNYQCTIRNTIGESEKSAKLAVGIEVKSGSMKMVIIIIVVVIVVVILVIMLIAIIIKRRRGPSQPTASKVPKKYAAAAKGAVKFEYKPVARKPLPVPDSMDNNENISEKELEKEKEPPIYATVDETKKKKVPTATLR